MLTPGLRVGPRHPPDGGLDIDLVPARAADLCRPGSRQHEELRRGTAYVPSVRRQTASLPLPALHEGRCMATTFSTASAKVGQRRFRTLGSRPALLDAFRYSNARFTGPPQRGVGISAESEIDSPISHGAPPDPLLRSGRPDAEQGSFRSSRLILGLPVRDALADPVGPDRSVRTLLPVLGLDHDAVSLVLGGRGDRLRAAWSEGGARNEALARESCVDQAADQAVSGHPVALVKFGVCRRVKTPEW